MRSRGELLSDYTTLRTRFAATKGRIDSTLSGYAAKEGYLYSSRLKTPRSYFEKLETGRFATFVLDDLLAASLVVPTILDVERCIASLPKSIEVLEQRDFSTRKKEPDVFRFDDAILVCRHLEADGDTDVLRFELQVRTLAQYAWSIVTHKPVYKGNIPEWRRLRLAAQFRAVSEQADLLFAEFEGLVGRVPESMSDSVDELVAVAKRIEGWCESGEVPEEFRPDSIRRTAESVARLCKEIGARPGEICDEVDAYLKGTRYPSGLSVFQVVVGVSLPRRAGQISWKRVTQSGYRVFLTNDAVAVFPGLREVPPACSFPE